MRAEQRPSVADHNVAAVRVRISFQQRQTCGGRALWRLFGAAERGCGRLHVSGMPVCLPKRVTMQCFNEPSRIQEINIRERAKDQGKILSSALIKLPKVWEPLTLMSPDMSCLPSPLAPDTSILYDNLQAKHEHRLPQLGVQEVRLPDAHAGLHLIPTRALAGGAAGSF